MQLSALYRFPLKSAAGEVLSHSVVDALGLAGDRRWMLVDTLSGRFLSQRLLPQLSQLRASWRSPAELLLEAPGMPALVVQVAGAQAPLRSVILWKATFAVPDAGDSAAAWLSDWLGRNCRLVYQPEALARQVSQKHALSENRTAFTDGYPLLLIGQASLDDLVARVGRPLSMLRFRPNLVVEGSAPYAEDDWKRIRIGSLELRVVKPCSRCIIPTIDLESGLRAADREPLATLQGYRQRDGEVFFGQNLLHQACGELAVGMPVEVLE